MEISSYFNLFILEARVVGPYSIGIMGYFFGLCSGVTSRGGWRNHRKDNRCIIEIKSHDNSFRKVKENITYTLKLKWLLKKDNHSYYLRNFSFLWVWLKECNKWPISKFLTNQIHWTLFRCAIVLQILSDCWGNCRLNVTLNLQRPVRQLHTF